LMQVLNGAGLSLALTAEQSLKVTPASNLTAELRDLIRASKTVLVEWLNREAANDTGKTGESSRWEWHRYTVMDGPEIDTFTARVESLNTKGVSLEDAERLADELLTRDRERDDRRMCLECAHLKGSGRWRCGNWQRADVSAEGLATDLVLMRQRCNGFEEVAL
jgi:hypothetical protein